ncbi:MAG: hypothetical protein KGJ80_17790 [Chloroflexota bacterium]|nr:hypothetical protein [Chloroflexota bacterium]
MQNTSEDGYQIATLVVVVLIVLVTISYLLVFINPRIAFNPFKPPLAVTPTVAIAALPALPPTWTPEPTDTTTPTATPTSTATPTLTPAPTNPPTVSPTASPRPTRTPAPIPPTLIPLAYTFRPVLQSCTHSGSTVIKGKVTSGGGPVDGVHVRLATSPDPATVQEEQTVRRDANGDTVYAFIIPPPGTGSFQWHIWVVDSEGTALSDPNYPISINTLPASDPQSCWLAIVDFVK